MKLRFIPPGSQVAEDVPPIDGEPPAEPGQAVVKRPVAKNDPVEMLEGRRRELAAEMKEIEARFATLRAEDAKLEQAIAVLKGTQ